MQLNTNYPAVFLTRLILRGVGLVCARFRVKARILYINFSQQGNKHADFELSSLISHIFSEA